MLNDKKNTISKANVVCAIKADAENSFGLPLLHYSDLQRPEISGEKVFNDKEAYVNMVPLIRAEHYNFEGTERHLFAMFLNEDLEIVGVEEYDTTRKTDLEPKAIAEILRSVLILKAKHMYLFTNLRHGALENDNADRNFCNTLYDICDSIGAEILSFIYLDNYIYSK